MQRHAVAPDGSLALNDEKRAAGYLEQGERGSAGAMGEEMANSP